MPELDVAVVIPSLQRNGGMRVLVEWANRLHRSGRTVGICAAAGGPLRDQLDSGIRINVPGKTRHLADEVTLRALRPFVGGMADLTIYPRTAGHRLPHAHTYVLGFAPWRGQLAPSARVLTYCQHWEPVWFESTSRAHRAAARSMLAPGPKVVNSSWLKAHWPAERQDELTLVYPGVDIDTFHPAADPSARRAGPMRVAALGRDDVRWKGLAELRQALAMSGLEVELFLFGTVHEGEVRRPWGLEHALGGLSASRLAELYRSVDVVVTPSWFESFPLPPLEAMACGTPVITTREGTEDYANDGENALVVPGRDVRALSDALARLGHDQALSTRLQEAGPATARKFTWSHGYSMFEDALEAMT